MTEYRISGIWKDSKKVITHYAFHRVLSTTKVTRSKKTTKEEAIKLIENIENTATTWVWNYSKSRWDKGEVVEVVNGENGKYLRSNPDSTLTDNLAHLIDFNWFSS